MNGRNLFAITLLSVSLIALELAWTRLFSAEFFHNYAFLILSLAILGLGAGALAARLFSSLGSEDALGWVLSLTALAALAGPVFVFRLDVDMTMAFRHWNMIWRLLVTVVILSAPFFLGGLALAGIFRRGNRRLPRLYMADLLGAGLGVCLIFPLMNAIGAPAAVFYCSVPVLLAALGIIRGWRKTIPLLLTAVMIALGTQAGTLLERERREPAPVIYKHWDAMAKVKIFDFSPDYRGLNIDNAANSPLIAFDGNWDRPDSMRFEFGIDVSYLMDMFDDCTFLSLGAGGGGDVLQALQAGCTEVHAVEVVPHINELMLSGEVAEFTGHIYDDPRVTVATEDARAYVRGFNDKFDIIYSLSSNTFAALASGAFAMAENYLFTTEAFGDYWNALSEDGFLSMEHQFYMPRLVSEALDALAAEGVEDPESHLAVYALPSMRRQLMLMSKRPLTDEIRNHAFVELSPELEEHIYLLYPAGEGHTGNRIQQIVENGWRTVADTTAVDISPCTDNRPFAAQLGLWKNFSWEKLDKVPWYAEVRGFPLSRMLIIVVMLVVGVLVVPLNLLPYLKRGEKLRIVPWLYFFVVGAAFMMVEVVLIQKYTFFVGPSAYSIAAILLTLLVGAGIGSLLSARVAGGLAFAGIIGWLLLDVFVFRHLIHALPTMAMEVRVLVTMLLVAPLGLCLGVPFPKGGLRVGELIDWAFAVNGTASVLGATSVMLVAFSWGFSVALLLAAALYALAFLLFSWRSAW